MFQENKIYVKKAHVFRERGKKAYVFSLLKLFFGEQQDSSLADQIQVALMLAYNGCSLGLAVALSLCFCVLPQSVSGGALAVCHAHVLHCCSKFYVKKL